MFPLKRSGAGYRWYVIAVLAAVYAFNTMDRNLLSILQEPIRQELHLSDAQLGSLTGLAFAVFYATLALPIARLADRSNRVVVAATALATWSLMTAACGAASGFVSLLILRMGVGVGEAGGYPPSASILSDYFARDRRATALAIFGVGAPIGGALGLLLGGGINQIYGWRTAFFVVGALGLVFAPIVLLTVREPRRGAAESAHDAGLAETPVTFAEVVRVIFRLKSYRLLLLGNCLHGFVLYSVASWNPPFYARVFHLSTGEIALRLGVLAGVCGALGTLLGGNAADWLGRRNERWHAWVVGFAALALVPATLGQYLVQDAGVSLALAAAPYFLFNVFVGPTIAMSQSLVLPNMRATTAAVTLMTYNIIGLGLGPFLTGVISDRYNAAGAGAESVRYALVTVVGLELVAATIYFLAGRYFAADLSRDRALDRSPPRQSVAAVAAASAFETPPP